MNKNNKKIIICLLVLLTLAISLISYNLSIQKNNKETLAIYFKSELISNISNNDLLSSDYTIDKEITQNKNGLPSIERNLTLISLNDVLIMNNIMINEDDIVKVSALDGFSAEYSYEEIMVDHNVYFILLEDNIKLDLKHGNFSVACLNDLDSTRWIRQIYKLEVI